MALAALALLAAVSVDRPLGSVSPPTQPAMVPRSESTPPQPAMVLQSDDETAGSLDSLGDRLPDHAVARLGSSRLRYGDWVRELLFSPDGRRLAVWGFGAALTICDAANGKTLRRKEMPETWLDAWTWIPDGRLAAILRDERGSVVFHSGPRRLLYDLNAAKPDGPLLSIEGPCAISPTGNRIAVGADGSESQRPSVKFLDVSPERPGGEFKVFRVAEGLPNELFRDLKFTPDGQTLVAFSFPRNNLPGSAWTAIVCDVKTAKERLRLTFPNGVLAGNSLDLSNERIAVASSDGGVSLYDLRTGAKLSGVPRPTVRNPGSDDRRPVELAVRLSRDGKMLATAGHDAAIRFWNVADGKPGAEIAEPGPDLKAMEFSPDGAVLAVGRRDGAVRLFKTSDGSDLCPQPGHQSEVRSVTVSMDGQIAATASHDRTIRVWDLANAKELRVNHCPGLLLTCAVSPDRKWILGVINVEAEPEAAVLHVWNLTDEPEGNARRLAETKAESLRFSPDGRTLLTVSNDVVTVWSWPKCEELRKFTIPRKPFGWAIANLLASSADGARLITSVRSVTRLGYRVSDSVGGTVDLFDTTTGKHLRELPGSGVWEQAAFAGSGELIVTSDHFDSREGSKSKFPHGAILVLDAETARVKRSVPTPGPDSKPTYDHIFAAAASPDGRTVYLARPEGTIHAWEVASGGVRYVLTGHRGEIHALAVFSRGRRLASAGADASVFVWDVSIPAVKAPDRVDPAWDDLASTDASIAYKAMALLSAAPDRTIRLLAAHLTEARPEPATDVPTTGRMREIRALEVLEHIGDADVRDVLATLAKGEPTALRTHDAAACLRRLQAK